MDWAHQHRIGLSPTEKLTLMALAFHAKRDGSDVYVSIETLAKEAELGERTVQRALAVLVERKVIMATVGGGRRNTTRYCLAVPSDWLTSDARKGANLAPNEDGNPASLAPIPADKPRQPDTLSGLKGANHDIKGANLAPEQQEEQQEVGKKEVAPPAAAPAAKPDPRGTRLPPEWQPSPDEAAYAVERGLDPVATAENFRGYWVAKAGKEARKADWHLTWQGWCRRDAERRPQTRAGPSPRSDEAVLRAAGLWVDPADVGPQRSLQGLLQ